MVQSGRGVFVAIAAVLMIVGVALALSESVWLSPGPSYGLARDCPVFFDVDFPPSDIEPILPPQNEHPYVNDSYVCRHFAFDFCNATRAIPEILKCDLLGFDEHAINVIVYKDPLTGKDYICFVEPQNVSEYYCKPLDDAEGFLNDEWIKEALCRKYYHFTKEQCEKSWFRIPRCDEAYPGYVGMECSPDEGDEMCVQSGDGLGWISCRCSGFINRKCTWRISTPGYS